MQWSARDLARHIDHTLLKPEACATDIARLCAEALEHQFWSVCVHGSRVAQASALLEGSEVKVAAVVGFPLGAMDGDAKRYETEVAIDLGAQEIDMVLNVGRLKAAPGSCCGAPVPSRSCGSMPRPGPMRTPRRCCRWECG